MNQFSQFEEVESDEDSLINEEEQCIQDAVCIRKLLDQPNPLMSKIEFTPYEAKNHFPAVFTKLPAMLNTHEYHLDRNNMILLEENAFAHDKMKKDLAKYFGVRKTIPGAEQLTLGEFYAGKALLYEKFTAGKSNYFATFVLKMSEMGKQASNQKTNRTGFIIRSNKTPLLTERGRPQRLNSVCKPQIDFNSNFQSGNLYKVYQREYNEYDLILQNDVNTKGNNQWFFFSARNVPKGTTVKFNIVNMAKRHSLFDYGMKPAVFSMMKYEKRQVGWVRDGAKVNYRESSQLRRETSQSPYHTLSFEYKFNYDGDIVYFSYSIPYTFTNLCTFLSNTLVQNNHHRKVRVRSVGETLGGNSVSLFELTNSQSRVEKKSIWIMGRQHSGEVSSSFMVEGIINFLLSGCEQAEYLLRNYLFRILPMLNIDGVVHGNARAELSGHDSNRKWSDPSKLYQPVLYNIKKMIEKDSVEMILDLHSHSRKLGTFFYCNSSPYHSNTIKIFPMLVCKNDERFDYRSNRFRGGNNCTARRVFYDLLNIPYIYTIESSLFGYQKEFDHRIIPYQPKDYREMGETVVKTFAQMMVRKKGMKLKDERLLLCREEELQQEGNLWDRMNQADQVQSVGSDEDPAGDELTKKELDAILQKKLKKTKQKKKKRVESKLKLGKKVVQPKKEDEFKLKKNDKESNYKKFFSGRTSMQKQGSTLLDFCRFKIETKNYGCQVEIQDKTALHRSSLNNAPATARQKSVDKLLEKKSLCVVGQKVEDDVVVSGSSVGVQAEVSKSFFRNRNEVLLQNRNLTRRLLHSGHKVAPILHNENNFLNRGDMLHKAMRMLNNR